MLEAKLIIDTVSDYFKVPVIEVLGTKRKREYVKARHISMYFIDIFAKGTLNEKGEPFGKDHDDIIFARHSVNNQAWVYKEYRNELKKILNKLNGKDDSEFERYKQFDTDKI